MSRLVHDLRPPHPGRDAQLSRRPIVDSKRCGVGEPHRRYSRDGLARGLPPDPMRSRGLTERSTEAHQGGGRPWVPEVLHVDDLAVLHSKRLRPFVPPPLLARPRERDNDTVATRLNGIDAVVAIAEHPLLRDSPGESLTGLVGAASGRCPQQPPQPPPSPPLHIGMDQRDERLDVAFTERFVRGAHRVNGHPERVLRRWPHRRPPR
jgi:hypothetical protein